MHLGSVSSLLRPLVAVFAFGPLLAGCGPNVSAHVVDVVVDDEGAVTRGELAFPAFCGTLGGDCPLQTRAGALVTGRTPVLDATIVTAGDGSSRRYDLTLRHGNDDQPTQPATDGEHIYCRVHHSTDGSDRSDFGKQVGCWNTTRNITVTLTFRGGDDGG